MQIRIAAEKIRIWCHNWTPRSFLWGKQGHEKNLFYVIVPSHSWSGRKTYRYDSIHKKKQKVWAKVWCHVNFMKSLMKTKFFKSLFFQFSSFSFRRLKIVYIIVFFLVQRKGPKIFDARCATSRIRRDCALGSYLGRLQIKSALCYSSQVNFVQPAEQTHRAERLPITSACVHTVEWGYSWENSAKLEFAWSCMGYIQSEGTRGRSGLDSEQTSLWRSWT